MQWSLLPSRGEYEFPFQFWYCEPPHKNQYGERKPDVVILGRFDCRWEGSEVTKVWEMGRVVGLRWIRWEGGEVGRWEGGKILILFKGGGWKTSQRFPLFYVNQGNKKGQDWFEIFCMAPSLSVWKSLQVLQKASINIVVHAIYSYQFFSFTYTHFYSVAE